MKALVGAVLVVLFWGSLAQAATLQLVSDSAASTSGIGAFTGSMSYDGVDTLTIALTNTTPVGGGYITGFVFNTPASASAVLAPNPTDNFEDLATSPHNNSLAGSPFGTFDAGAAIDGDFLGGGSPSAGIAVGDTGTFVFHVTNGSGASVDDFFFNDGTDYPFVVRLRGIDIGAGSDKVPANSIPLPPALWSGMSMFALAGIAGLVRRVKRA
jgi:hypothetical protein